MSCLLLILVGLLFLIVFLCVLHQTIRRQNNPYREGDPRYHKEILTEYTHTHETIVGFSIPYRLSLRCLRVNNEQFDKNQMLNEGKQHELATSFNNNVFRHLLAARSWFFHLELWPELGRVENVIRTPIIGVFKEEGSMFVREASNAEVMTMVKEHSFQYAGCEVELVHFGQAPFSRELVEANYAMLSKEHKIAVLNDDRFGMYEEMLAVAALKRRLDFLDNRSQTYESDLYSVDTEMVGRGLKIKWRFKSTSPGYDLVVFRRTGGFYPDQWDEANNGALVIQSNKNGETIELLKECEAHFYTAFLKPHQEDQRHRRCSPLRFQVTIASSDETEAIRSTLERIESRGVDQGSHNLGRALRELGLSVEIDNAVLKRIKVLEQGIRDDRTLSGEEKQEQIERLHEKVPWLREKYGF